MISQSKDDGRVYYLELTEKGRRIIEGDTKLYQRVGEIILDSVPAKRNEKLAFPYRRYFDGNRSNVRA